MRKLICMIKRSFLLLIVVVTFAGCSRSIPIHYHYRNAIDYKFSWSLESKILTESSQNIKTDTSYFIGHVINAFDLIPIPGCRVIITTRLSDTIYYGLTDPHGNFHCRVDPGEYIAELNYVGYNSLKKVNFKVEAGVLKKIIFSLSEDPLVHVDY